MDDYLNFESSCLNNKKIKIVECKKCLDRRKHHIISIYAI